VVNIALHGLGRVGRSILRRCALNPEFNVVAINELTSDIDNIAYCLNYDSIHGPYPEKFVAQDSNLLIGERRIRVLNESDIRKVRWNQLGADVIIDSSGVSENTQALKTMVAEKSLAWSFKTCLAPEADLVLTLGCNENNLRGSRHRVISSNTCDATAIAPVINALEKGIGIDDVSLSIIHPWLNHQNLLDSYSPAIASKNYELGRASAGNIIAKTTSAESAIRAVLPGMDGVSISALSYRVPTSIVTCADLSLRFERATDREEVLSILREYQKNSQWKLIGFNREPLVSSDFTGSDYSSTIEERLLTINGKLGRITLWYDNESGYAARVLDQIRYCASGVE
jgi:glyceraldehyde 3-phosphate dehydrogenase